MRTRQDIKKEYQELEEQIRALKAKQLDLNMENIVFSDEQQWYEEKEEELPEWIIPEGKKKRHKKIMKKHLVGRVHWNESFIDEDEPKDSFIIPRSEIIKIDGVWQPSFYSNL